MEDNLKGLLIIISGPSGVGKGTVIKKLKQKYTDFVYPISCTTREMRPGEEDGGVYHFISKDDFEEGIEQGDFLEWAMVHQTNYYGTPKKPIIDSLEQGKVVLREVDVQGAQSIQKIVPEKNLVTIFIKAESEEKLLERIAKRGELPQDEVERRMESAKKEMGMADEFDYQVWNYENRVDECVEEVERIIDSEMEKAGLKN